MIGRSLVDHLCGDPQWDVVALSRRAADYATPAQFLSVDLRDRDATRATLAKLDRTTHVFYAAYQPMPSRAHEAEPNLALLVNSVEALAAASPTLEHVNLMEGGKWYGSHLGPFRMPAVEDDPRHMPPNFDYDQQDWLELAAACHGFSWSALRLEAVCGFAVGNPMNLTMAIAVYPAICVDLDVPFSFPGKPGAWTATAGPDTPTRHRLLGLRRRHLRLGVGHRPLHAEGPATRLRRVHRDRPHVAELLTDLQRNTSPQAPPPPEQQEDSP